MYASVFQDSFQGVMNLSLAQIEDPRQLLGLDDASLTALGQEVRQRIISTVASNGGHLAPSLGTVELTLALLAEFNPAKDKLLWDVGHQAYAYKLLTGRADQFHTLRQYGGISGFPRMEESPYDHFGVGHSSTSISAALGMATARDLQGKDHHVISVIGDGSLTGGEALEGLNLAGHMGKRLIVILNDNEMSISSNVGAISLFLSRTLSRKWLRQTRREVLNFLRNIPHVGQKLATYAMRGEWSFKSFFTPGMLFEAFRFNYIGPVDGHDLQSLRRHLRAAAAVTDGPVLLHVRTKKGRGYPPAEKHPTLFHGVGPFDEATGQLLSRPANPGFTQIFSETLIRMAEADPSIIAITAAMPEGTGTDKFRERFPERFVDTGICEQHAVTFAAGLASQGYRPVVAIYSTFLQRAYDQILHDVCLQNLPVVFCVDRAGLVGEDGATHHGAFDIAYLRHIPNMHILAPRDENVLQSSLRTAVGLGKPCAVRYPRGAGFGAPLTEPSRLEEGKGELLREGDDLLLLPVGACVHPALEAATMLEKDGYNVAVFDPIWLKPMPAEQILSLCQKFSSLVLVEEGSRAGGFSSAVLELLADHDALDGKIVRRLGLPDRFMQHGKQQILRAEAGLDGAGIYKTCLEILKKAGERRV